MASSTATAQLGEASDHSLQIDFSWTKFKCRVTKTVDGEQVPTCVVDFHTFRSTSLEFKDPKEEAIWATGTLHSVAIHADCMLRGNHIRIQPLSRLKMSCMHMSRNFSDTDTAVQMTWVSDTNFRTCDYICLGPDKIAVAKFTAHIWAARKVARIEFAGSKALQSEAAREEILAVGLTLWSQMLLRTNNFLNLFGSAVANPKKEVKKLQDEAEKASDE